MSIFSRCFIVPALCGCLAFSLCLRSAPAEMQEKMTPLLLAVEDAPVPFTGSDGRVHLVYELRVTNFSSGDMTVERVEVLDNGVTLESLDAKAIAARLQAVGRRESAGKLAGGSQALLFVHVTLAPGAMIPERLSHRVTIHAVAAPPGQQEITETGGEIAVNHRTVVVIGPPLRGDGYISADSCCDSSRHMRAAMPINGRVWLAQRFAVDWEQLNAQGRIYAGPRERLESYTIFGKEVLAVADAVVVSVTDGLAEQTPGKFPEQISLEEADGNSVVLDLGGESYALYAHMQPGSIRVHKGEHVKLGQVIGLVGNTGNSVAPHLHFQVMDRASSLASNGLPYEIDKFQIVGSTPGTEAFDKAEAEGTELKVKTFEPLQQVGKALPLDQLIIDFPVRQPD